MPQKYRFDLSLYFTKFFVDDNHMKLLMDPSVVLEELGIKDEDSILSEIRSRYDFRSSICKQTAICLLPVVCLFIGALSYIHIFFS